MEGPPPCSYVHMFTTLPPNGSRVCAANRPRDRTPFTTPFKLTTLPSAVLVARLQVRQVEDLEPEVLEVAVAVGLFDQPADLVVEAFY